MHGTPARVQQGRLMPGHVLAMRPCDAPLRCAVDLLSHEKRFGGKA